MKKFSVRMTLLIFVLIFPITGFLIFSSPATAGRTYFDSDGNKISEAEYQEQVRARNKGLTGRKSSETDTEENLDKSPSEGVKVPLREDQDKAGKTTGRLRIRSSNNEKHAEKTGSRTETIDRKSEIPVMSASEKNEKHADDKYKESKLHIPGQREQPVSVTEKIIDIPGSGKLRIKKYEYE